MLEIKDLHVSIDGKEIDSSMALRKIVSEYRWGDVVAATIRRDEEIVPLEIHFRRKGIYSGN